MASGACDEGRSPVRPARNHSAFAVAVILVLAGALPALASGVARRRSFQSPIQIMPPLGWNPWNQYGCSANETIIRQSADALVSTGLANLGYDWVHLDDCWMLAELDTQGRLQVDLAAYPSGMKALGDYIHSKGLKFGIYASSGNTTCQLRAGSLGHELTHATQFAEWGVDGLKYDNCHPPPDQLPAQPRYARMATALANVSRPIYLNIADNGLYETPTWAYQYGSTWIISEDIKPTWASITSIADLTSQWAPYAGPTLGWNDADMLEVGNGNLSFVEGKAHFSVWAIVKSPLWIGTDLLNMTAETFAVLSNKEVIDVNQDTLGAQATVRVHDSTMLQVWAGPLSGNRVIVLLWNRSEQPANITAVWAAIDLPPGTRVIARDLWQHAYYPQYYTDNITLGPIAPHDVILLRLEPNTVLPAPVPYLQPLLPPPPGLNPRVNISPASAPAPAPGSGPAPAPAPGPAPAPAPSPGNLAPVPIFAPAPSIGSLGSPAAAPCSITKDVGNCSTPASQSVPATSATPLSSPPSGAVDAFGKRGFGLSAFTALICILMLTAL